MDVTEARRVLGVTAGDGWDVVRAAYRRLIRAAHPDTVEPSAAAGATARAVRLNDAYASLSRAKRAGALDGAGPPGGTAAPPSAPAAPPPPDPPPVGTRLVDGDTLLLAAPHDEAFTRLVDAAHRVGVVSYVDRSCAIFEAVVRLDGEACSLVVTTQGRAHGTEAFLTVESLERVATHSPEPFARRLAAVLA